MHSKQKILLLLIFITLTISASSTTAQHFSQNNESALLYGTHEIYISSDTPAPNPFDTPAEITFYPPQPNSPVTIPLFYDGNNTWRGRTYITATGNWTWHTYSPHDPKLDNRSGSFTAEKSNLPGKLRTHPANPKAFATERGQTFLNIADTAYYLFSGDPAADTWQEFIKEDWDMGIRMLRGLSLGEFATGLFMGDSDFDHLNLETFQRTDLRLQWMLNHYPDMYVEFILFQFERNWKKDEDLWASLTPIQKDRILRQYVGRYAAYPQILWEIHNDLRYEPDWNNTKAAIEIGTYLKENDPWGTFITTGAYRDAPFPFPDEPWVSFIHLETINALPAAQIVDYAHLPMPVFNGEDRYEEYRGPAFPQYYYRRLMWAWILSGSSATYGQRWHNDDGATLNQPLTPYSQTPYTGLHSIKFIRPFFEERNIDIALFQEADHLARDIDRLSTDPENQDDSNQPQVAINGQKEILIYHPNANESKHQAHADPEITAGLILNLRTFEGAYHVEWFNPLDGQNAPGGKIHGGTSLLLRAPWPGVDALLYIKREE